MNVDLLRVFICFILLNIKRGMNLDTRISTKLRLFISCMRVRIEGVRE